MSRKRVVGQFASRPHPQRKRLYAPCPYLRRRAARRTISPPATTAMADEADCPSIPGASGTRIIPNEQLARVRSRTRSFMAEGTVTRGLHCAYSPKILLVVVPTV